MKRETVFLIVFISVTSKNKRKFRYKPDISNNMSCPSRIVNSGYIAPDILLQDMHHVNRNISGQILNIVRCNALFVV